MGEGETTFTEALGKDQSPNSASNINGRVVAACDRVVMAVLDFGEGLRTGRIDILDVLLIGWLVLTTCVFLGFTIYEKSKNKEREAAEKERKRKGITNDVYVGGSRPAGSSFPPLGGPLGGPSFLGGGDQYGWLNSVVAWLFSQHSQQSPGQLAASWLKTLNDESKKQGSSVQVTFDRLKPGNTAPKFQNVQAESGPKDHLIVTCQLDVSGFGFVVFATQQTTASVKLSTCDVAINRLSGKVRCLVRGIGEEWQLAANWEKRPELTLNIRPQTNTNTRNNGVDLVVVEEIIRNAIMAAGFNMLLPMRALPREVFTAANSLNTNTQPQQQRPVPYQPIQQQLSNNTNRMPQTMYHTPIVPTNTNHVSSKPPTMAETRLLVKVIKANGLTTKTIGGSSSSDPYCIAQLDQPPQRYKTNTIVNTTNPFWDEHFLFQLNNSSTELRFEVWGKGNRDMLYGEALLPMEYLEQFRDTFYGEAVVPVDSLEHMRGSRHILPLGGVTADGENVKGSLTVWFLFMESAEQNTEIKPRQPVSPTKRVETSRSVAPDGTVITMVTTTTAKPKGGERRVGGNDAPMRVVTTATNIPTPQRPGMIADAEGMADRSHHSTGTQSMLDVPRPRVASETSAKGSNTPPTPRSATSVSDTAIKHLSESAGEGRQKTPTKKSTLTIHGVSQTPNVDLSTLSDEPSDKNFKRDASPNRSKRGFKLFRRRSKKNKPARSVSLDESDLHHARQQVARQNQAGSPDATLPRPEYRGGNTLEVPGDGTDEPLSAESSPRRVKKKMFGFLKRSKSKEREYGSHGTLPKTSKAQKQEAHMKAQARLTVPERQGRSASTGDIGFFGEFELRRPSADDTESNVSGSSYDRRQQQPTAV